MKLTLKKLASAVALMSVAGHGYAADSLVSFTSGSAAKASEVNANFEYLESKIDAISTESSSSYISVDIDCTDDNTSLLTYLEDARFAGHLDVTLTGGTCIGPITINKDDVTINGGTIEGGLDGDEYVAIDIDGRNNIRIIGTEITSGITYILRESNARFEGVTFPATNIADEENGEYEANLVAVASAIRIKSGSLNNLAINLQDSAFLKLYDGLTGTANSIIALRGSSIRSKLDSLSVDGAFGVVLSSSFQGNDISVGTWIEASGTSSIYASSISSDNAYLALYEGAGMSIDGDVTALAMECHTSSFWIGGNTVLTGTHEEAGDHSIEFAHGCGGEFGGTLTLPTGGTIDKSSGSDVTYINDSGEYSDLESVY